MGDYTFQGYVSAILEHRPQSVGLAPPRLLPNEHRAIAREAYLRSGDAFDHPADLAIREGFRLYRADLPRRCGVHLSGSIYIPKWCPQELEPLIIDHERGHGWSVRRREEANEADAWWVTVHLALPENRLGETNPHLTPYFQALFEEAHDSITFVMMTA